MKVAVLLWAACMLLGRPPGRLRPDASSLPGRLRPRIKKDGKGIYDVSARAPPSVLIPFVQGAKANGSTIAYNFSSPG